MLFQVPPFIKAYIMTHWDTSGRLDWLILVFKSQIVAELYVYVQCSPVTLCFVDTVINKIWYVIFKSRDWNGLPDNLISSAEL